MRFSLLTITLLLASGALLLAALFLISSPTVTAHWDSSGGIDVDLKDCDIDSECGTGNYCFNFKCFSCGGCPVCQDNPAGGGCGCGAVNEGGACNGAGYFCSGGSCINCQPAGGTCTTDANCCTGNKCDISNSKCVACDANKVQTNPPVTYGGGKCEASCGASSQCDEILPGGFAASGICSISSPNSCLYFDGDLSSAACTSAVGSGNWSLGGEVAQSTCCGDDAGEFNRFRDCKPGSCVDNPADRRCCNADKDCVHNGQCYYDVDSAIPLVQAANAAWCVAKPNQNACASGEAKVKCQWNPGPPGTCGAAATKAAVQYTQKFDDTYKAYADVNNDGSDEVCVATSPGQWEGKTYGSVSGVVRNITSTVQGVLVRVLDTSLSATTAGDGSYVITNVLTGNHDVVASKSEYEASSVYGVFVPDGGAATADFTLVRALGDCEDDCTKVGSNLCDASCHGKGLCWFYSDATKQACDGTFGLTEMFGGQYVDCCMGKAYMPIKAQASVPSKNVVVTKRPVLYKGKFVNMVIVVFNK